MALRLGYCTVLYANSVNDSSAWDDLSVTQKEFAISAGRNFIDSHYACTAKYSDSSSSDYWDTADYTTIPDEIQWANAYLSDQYAIGTLTASSDKSGPITKKKVKAGEVEVETTYQGLYASSGGKSKDPFPDVTLMISQYCALGSANVTLIRV